MHGVWILGTIITEAAHELMLLEMQPASSSKHISSSTHFWHLRGMRYALLAINGPVVGISISNRLALPTSVEDLDIMFSNSFSSKEESLSLASCVTCASCGTCASCNIINYI